MVLRSHGSPNSYIHQHASSQEEMAELCGQIPREREIDKYFQTAALIVAHLSISPLNCCPFACITKPDQKCTQAKQGRKGLREKSRNV